MDEFKYKLLYGGKFSVDSFYRVLIQPNIPVDDNSKIWKMMIPLKTKIFACISVKGRFLRKIILLGGIGMVAQNAYFVIIMRQYAIYSSIVNLLVLYGQSFK